MAGVWHCDDAKCEAEYSRKDSKGDLDEHKLNLIKMIIYYVLYTGTVQSGSQRSPQTSVSALHHVKIT